MRGNIYQYALISLGAISTALFGVFFYRELFPEYKIYQDDYIEIEKFRSSYTHEPPPGFKVGVKQILLERSDKGNPLIDRCTSCHVALEFPHFSPTKVARDINGNILIDQNGIPKKVFNEDYVWAKIDEKIAALEDEKVNLQLKAEGDKTALKQRQEEAEKLKSLKVAHVDEVIFDVTKVLSMHPLIGKETRPFEFHPVEEYGCTSCHNGNGRGITTLTAHGPVFDEQFEKEFVGEVPHFTEIDPENDPRFSKVFNGKPGHKLLFQTTPLFVGALIQAKCVQCHLSSSNALQSASDMTASLINRQKKQVSSIATSLSKDKLSLLTLLKLENDIQTKGSEATLKELESEKNNYTLPTIQREQAANQYLFLTKNVNGTPEKIRRNQLVKIQNSMAELIGKIPLVTTLSKEFAPYLTQSPLVQQKALDAFVEKYKGSNDATGDIFTKLTALNLENQVERHIQDVDTSFQTTLNDQQTVSNIATDIDLLTKNFKRGQELFINQACYACHRISGYSRGGVGPELTLSGEGYPWYIKESLVWPQADLHTSTMPNYSLDHEELEDLVTYMLGQTGSSKAVSSTDSKAALQSWEAGRKLSWEKPITPVQMLDLRYAMTVFATEGCAACHRLTGFDANVGFSIEKQSPSPSFEAMQDERNWFQSLFPEEITGTNIVKTVESHAKEIDQHISPDVRTNGLLDEIERTHPKVIESLYTPFKFASRAKNAHYESLAKAEKDPEKKEALLKEQQAWKERIHHLMFLYAQEYGLGRLIGPRPNWSGIFRTDEWLMEHFRNPSAHVPRSIMPIFPFDETKFYALTRMLDTLGIRNRNANRKVWEEQGFNPAKAYEIYCAQCHGDFLQGNGPVAPWIYPIPKNLRNGEFLRNLTRERVVDSIKHGIKGTPMPPWGEVAADKTDPNTIPVLTENEIQKLTDWLFSTLPGGTVIRTSEDVPKWQYLPDDVMKELYNEGNLEKFKKSTTEDSNNHSLNTLDSLPKGEGLLASLEPMVAVAQTSTENSPFLAVFDEKPTTGYPDAHHYYIKKKYYTPENVELGRQFFEYNCAVCHGKEGDGAGARAGTMAEAKPRMLTNLDWINTRDDLHLLRSIKYGVPGTAMTPWGDLTSSLQRLQLVMFIRTLSQERALREQLTQSLYKVFDETDLKIEQMRLNNYKSLIETELLYAQVQVQQQSLYRNETKDAPKGETFLELYEKEHALSKKIDAHKKRDSEFLELKALLKKERDLLQTTGLDFIQNNLSDFLVLYDSMIDLLADRIQFKNNTPIYHFSEAQEKAFMTAGTQLLLKLTSQIESADKETAMHQSAINTFTGSSEDNAKILESSNRSKALTTLKNRLIFTFAEAARLQDKEKKLIVEFSKAPSTTQESNNG